MVASAREWPFAGFFGMSTVSGDQWTIIGDRIGLRPSYTGSLKQDIDLTRDKDQCGRLLKLEFLLLFVDLIIS